MPSRRSPRRAARRSVLVSFSLHGTLIAVLAALLQPAGDGPQRPLVLEVSSTEPAPEPELIVMSEAAEPPNAGERLTEDDSDVFAREGQQADYLAADAVWTAGRAGSGTADGGRRGSGPGASFFGTVAHGNQFVYVVDISTSMDRGQGASASQGSRFIRAMAELRASIERLTPKQSFYVVLFNGDTRRMFDDIAVFPTPLAATGQNKRRLFNWLSTVRTGDWTDPRQALRIGLSMRPSALFLLSDGEFNGQQKALNAGLLKGNPSVSEVIETHNRGRTPIHAIAYEDKASCLAMEQIARSTGGDFQFIPPFSSAETTKSIYLADKRASYLLSRAKLFESRGRWKQALAMYRRIERDYPASEAAQTAAAKTTELSVYNR